MHQTSNLLSVGHSQVLSVNPLKGNLRSIFCTFLLIWMTYGQIDYQLIKNTLFNSCFALITNH